MNPYKGRPGYQFWKHGGGLDDLQSFDPVTNPSFKISPSEPVVTAGSCFAQHVARHLKLSGCNVLVTEEAHPLIPDKIAAKFYYAVFSARYGNIYTARQLRQLLERAYNMFVPRTSAWQSGDDRWVDPFRPQIQPGGYVSVQELELDRVVHLAAVRSAIERMSVFVFTLGLTEAWMSKEDGAVYPLAPGVAGGVYDPQQVSFVNFSARQTTEDLEWSLNFIRRINPDVKIILTVSPVPLAATAEDRHVLVSTVYSKAALRVAAEEASSNLRLVDYFPSFEIITSPHSGSKYFGEDHRSVTEAGVSHVMKIFLRHYTETDEGASKRESVEQSGGTSQSRQAVRSEITAMEKVVQALCDEEALSRD